jgi:hypothetical protein
MTNVVSIDPESRFVGKWKCCDGLSEVTFNVSIVDGSFAVSVIDPECDVVPEIHGTIYHSANRTLEFSVHWPTTGRFTKYNLIPSRVAGRVEVTFTYTSTELWERVI